MDVKETVSEILDEFKKEYSQANDLDALEDLRIKYLGKKGRSSKVI